MAGESCESLLEVSEEAARAAASGTGWCWGTRRCRVTDPATQTIRFNIFIAFKYFYTYTIRPRDCLYGELPPGRRISTGGIILFWDRDADKNTIL